jgi:hypothetical protein
MTTVTWKKTTDLIVTSVREQMLRLKTYYRCMGSCSDCKQKLAFNDYDDAGRITGWRIVRSAAETRHAALSDVRTAPVCIACHERRRAA